MSAKYIGVTIGPIHDTISLTSSPAGLWAASYMFSHISRRLCELIVIVGLVESDKDILSPYYSKSDPLLQERDGIGLFHDRIIFEPKNEQTALAEIRKLFDQIVEEIAALFDIKSVYWFNQYLQLHAICFESNGNPILDSSKYLDAIELEKTAPSGENPITALFQDSHKNDKIRKNFTTKLKLTSVPFPLRKEKDNDGNEFERMPQIVEITGRADEKERPRRKINSYYAIVQSDGDKFGDYIKGCKRRNESEQDFSRKCLMYCSEAAQAIQNYGGVTIYAGGDDLLFIAPLISSKQGGKSFLYLLEDLRKMFDGRFEDEKPPTLSFGVAICYHRYPLYEAFDEAYKMLFDQAKENRNAVGISMLKHSGQSIKFVLEDFKSSGVIEQVKELIKQHIEEDILKSVSKHIWQFQDLFLKALALFLESNDKKYLENIFENIFDNEIHSVKKGNIESVFELLVDITQLCADSESKKNPIVREIVMSKKLENEKRVRKEEGLKEDVRTKTYDREIKILYALDALLRFVKFWGEKGDEDDAEVSD